MSGLLLSLVLNAGPYQACPPFSACSIGARRASVELTLRVDLLSSGQLTVNEEALGRGVAVALVDYLETGSPEARHVTTRYLVLGDAQPTFAAWGGRVEVETDLRTVAFELTPEDEGRALLLVAEARLQEASHG